MTWEQFKEQVESQGVEDTDEIYYIDVHVVGNPPLCTAEVEGLGVKIVS